MARTRVMVYEDRRGWRYYWREGDPFAYMLRAHMGADLAVECGNLDEHSTAPLGSVGCRWTSDLFDAERVRLLAIYEKGRLRRMS
ncbi:MAG: hypothetical protein ACRDHP_09565 [Ktedonobacterales bacterium]